MTNISQSALKKVLSDIESDINKSIQHPDTKDIQRRVIRWIRDDIASIALTPASHQVDLVGDIDWLVLVMLKELHANVPADKQPMGMCDLSDDQAVRAKAAVRAVMAALTGNGVDKLHLDKTEQGAMRDALRDGAALVATGNGSGWIPDWLLEIAHKLRTQDNRITSEPLFCVFQKRRIWGMDPDYAEQWVWLDKDADRSEVDESEVELDEFDDPVKDNYEKAYYIEVDEFVNAHLTDEAAKLYIAQNHYKLKKPFTYVTSQYRCHEYIQLRNWLLSLPSPNSPASGEPPHG